MKKWIAGLCLVAFSIAGCKHQCFLAEKDFKDAHLLPSQAETDRTLGEEPIAGLVATPPDVNQPDRPARFLTLQEAIAVSLENGNANARGIPGQGLVDDTPASFAGGNQGIIGQSDSIRVLALTPALNYTFLEQTLARYDAQWISSMNWTTTDNLQQGLSDFNNGQRASFFTGIMKPTSTGGVLTTFFETDYQLLNNAPQNVVLNPTYTTRLRLGFEQPLLQNFGTDVNQLLNRLSPISGITVPGQAASLFNQRGQVLNQAPSVAPNPTEGILVARLRFNSSRAEFERQLNGMVLNVEVAYWNLYQAYGELYTFEEVLRIAHKSWMINQAKFVAGTIGPANFYPIRGQYEEFRGERLRALGKVLEAERNLRGLMGIPIEDGDRLVPITPPTLAPYRPDWNVCVQDALHLRPELVIAREAIRAAQYNIDVQKNFLKPDLRFNAQYIPTGFGSRLDGRDTFIDGAGNQRPQNALQSLSDTSFEDWTVGLTLNVPIGYRVEHASIRAGRIALAQSFFALKDQEERVQRFLTQQYQKLAEFHARIEAARAERKAYAESVDARFREFTAGKTVVSDFLLEAQRRLALAQQKEYLAVAEYNNSLSRLEWAKGTILKHNNIIISEGALPQCAEVRAVDHERERAKSIVLLEKPLPMTRPGQLSHNIDDLPETLEVPSKAVEEAGVDLNNSDLFESEKLPLPRKLTDPDKTLEKAPLAPLEIKPSSKIKAGKVPVPFDHMIDDDAEESPFKAREKKDAAEKEGKKDSSGWMPPITTDKATPKSKGPSIPAPVAPELPPPPAIDAPKFPPAPELDVPPLSKAETSTPPPIGTPPPLPPGPSALTPASSGEAVPGAVTLPAPGSLPLTGVAPPPLPPPPLPGSIVLPPASPVPPPAMPR